MAAEHGAKRLLRNPMRFTRTSTAGRRPLAHLLVLFVQAGCPSQPAPDSTPAPTPALDQSVFRRVDAAGLAEELGRTAPTARVYNFWATWCAPCIAEFPEIQAFAKQNPSVALTFVNTDHHSIPAERLERLITEHRLAAYSHLRPASGELDLTAQVENFPAVLPTTIVIHAGGTTRKTIAGSVTIATLEGAIRP